KSDAGWESRRHFFFAAARAMRDILVEQARRKAGPVRGGRRQRQELDEACAVLEPPAEDVLAVHDALEELEQQEPRKTGLNSLPGFDRNVAAQIAELTGLPFVTAPNKFTVQGAHDDLVQLSATLKTLAVPLFKSPTTSGCCRAARATASPS